MTRKDLSHFDDTSTGKPRILLVLPGFSAGGAERVASTMLNYWASSNHQNGLLTLASQDDEHYPLALQVSRLSLDMAAASSSLWHGMKSNLQRMRMLRNAVVEFAPQVVISFIDRTNILVLAALIGTGLPVIVSERIDPRQYVLDPLRRVLRRCLYPRAECLVVQTDGIADWARSVTKAHRVAVIANPINELPEPSAFSNRPRTIIAMGRLTHQKGFDLLIRAFAQRRMGASGWQLNILGEGPGRAALQKLIDEHGLADQVTLVGVVSEPWQWLDKAQIFALSSRFEGFPNALLEAMAMGCACIATDCASGPAEIITSGENGLLIPTEDIDALVLALERLETDQALAAQLSDRAQLVRKRFAVEKIMSQWEDIIGQVVR